LFGWIKRRDDLYFHTIKYQKLYKFFTFQLPRWCIGMTYESRCQKSVLNRRTSVEHRQSIKMSQLADSTFLIRSPLCWRREMKSPTEWATKTFLQSQWHIVCTKIKLWKKIFLIIFFLYSFKKPGKDQIFIGCFDFHE